QMMERQEDVFYYVTLMNENNAQPSLPAGVEGDIVKGLYRFATHDVKGKAKGRVRLVGSGTILREVIAAAELLAADWGVEVEVWSATSFSELSREAREVERHSRLHPAEPARISHLQRCLSGSVPVIAASDYIRAWPQLVGTYLDAPFTALGTDGFGRSDTRAALRRFFEVDRHHVVLAALTALRAQGAVDASVCAEAITRYGIEPDATASWNG
ncbi:MAG: pyruvate dehydrogenase (acetyl-transferring), homodimeric type, partial [Piscinibacter sp.]|uniref:transketolase-like TK C-terminal-containing protein n=1 Tax=Piscinibacter sp. TaxID=1903157 RepID=UPI003D0A7821